MNLLLDTNLLLYIIRAKDQEGMMNFINPNNSILYISIASEAELRALAARNGWGEKKKRILNTVLGQVNIMDITKAYVNVYAEIDSYSQLNNPNFSAYNFDTPRNMGKNDLWIASLAALLGLTLITTDADFDHLDDVFFNLTLLTFNDIEKFF